jgi:ATPase subunit of ABC transporter with duplicated ATPase domains
VERADAHDESDKVREGDVGTEWQTSSATDVIVPCFSMSAPGKSLLVDASLRIVSGKRYGVMGSNGCGKSTLLHFLAARRLPIPNGNIRQGCRYASVYI